MEINEITLKIYIKNKKIPFTAILSSEKQLENFVNELKSTEEVIKFGDIIFLKKDLKYITIKH